MSFDPSADVFPTLTPDLLQRRNLAAVTPVITIQIPAGNYAIGQSVNMNAHPGMTIKGFDMYLKYNGAEFLRITDYRAMAFGHAAIHANSNYDFRDVRANHFATKSLLSDHKNNVIDARDFGMKQVSRFSALNA